MPNIGYFGVYSKDANVLVVVTNEPAACHAFSIATGVSGDALILLTDSN